MARGRKVGTVFPDGYNRSHVVVTYPSSAAGTKSDWKVHRVAGFYNLNEENTNNTLRTLIYRVRASRATAVAAAVRALSIGGQHPKASVTAEV